MKTKLIKNNEKIGRVYVQIPECCEKTMGVCDWRDQTLRVCRTCDRTDVLRKDGKWQTTEKGNDGQGLNGLVKDPLSRGWY